MVCFRRMILLLALVAITQQARAQDIAPAADNPGDNRTTQAPDETHPIYSADANWIGSMMIGIAGLFLAAMVIGPIIRAEVPDSVPIAVSHEEDPAADRQ